MEKSSKASQVSSPTTLPSVPLILYLPVNLPLSVQQAFTGIGFQPATQKLQAYAL